MFAVFNSGFNESTARISSSPTRTSSQFDELNDHDSELEFTSDEEGEDGGIDEDDDSAVDETETESESEDGMGIVHPSSSTPRPSSTLPATTSADFSISSTIAPSPIVVAPSIPRSRTSSAAISNDGDQVEPFVESAAPSVTGDLSELSAGETSEVESSQQTSTPPPLSPSRRNEPRFVDARSAPPSPARLRGFSMSQIEPSSKVANKQEQKKKENDRPRSEVIVADAS